MAKVWIMGEGRVGGMCAARDATFEGAAVTAFDSAPAMMMFATVAAISSSSYSPSSSMSCSAPLGPPLPEWRASSPLSRLARARRTTLRQASSSLSITSVSRSVTLSDALSCSSVPPADTLE